MAIKYRNYTAAIKRALAQISLPAPAWQPSDVGLTCANFDLPSASSSGGLTAGWLYISKLHIRSALTLSNLWWGVGGSASGGGTVNAGVYDQNGNQLTDCGNIQTLFTLSTYAGPAPLTTPQSLTSWVWIMLLSNTGAAQAQPRSSAITAALANLALPNSQWEHGVITGAHAALPASFSPAAMINSVAVPIWVGGS